MNENKDLNYLIDLELSESVDPKTKTDSIRSKLFLLDSTKGSFESMEAFQHLRHKLMTELAEELDRSDGKNTYLSEAMASTSRSTQDKQNECLNGFESKLFRLSEQQLIEKLNLKSKMRATAHSNDCQVIGIVLNTKTNTNINVDNTDDVDSGLETNVLSQELVEDCALIGAKTNIFDRIGSFKSGFVTKRSNSCSVDPNLKPKVKNVLKRQISANASPTQVSGIFKSNNSPKETNCGQTPPKRLFITGLEKKLSTDVRNRDIDLKSAQNIIKQMRHPFKNPIKSNRNDRKQSKEEELEVDPNLKNIDPKMIETIENEIITNLEPIEWSDVAGLGFAKKKIHEIAVLPLLRPDLFSGLRKPPKGILLFGPPGTGKTYLGRCIASQTKSTFFSITVSALNSKWIGEGEKMIRALFAVARARQPSVIFIDEIDSLLKNRSDSEHESSRRMKTEFLAQFEGVTTDSTERLLIIGATNRPQELDDAARRRLSAKLYIRLPDTTARKQIIENSIKSEKHNLSAEQINDLAEKTDGYSGADMRDLCHESAMEAIRESIVIDKIDEINETEIRGMSYEDFIKNLDAIKPTVRKEDLKQFDDWNQMFGQKNF